MAKPLLTIRCPDDLIQVIQKQEELTGLDRTKVVVGMLEQSLPSVLVSERNKLPAIPAIYLVWLYNRLLYIGRTSNLKQRWTGHHRILHFINAGENCRISWFQINADDLSTLPSLEASLIELLEPEHNNTDTAGGSSKYKIQGYVTQEMYDRFKAECSERGLSESQLLNQILSEYFDITQSASKPATNSELENRLKSLEDQISALIELNHHIANNVSEVDQRCSTDLESLNNLCKFSFESAFSRIGRLERGERVNDLGLDESVSESQAESLPHEMSLKQVAEYIGLNDKRLIKTRKEKGDRFLEYLQEKSGKVWEFDPKADRHGKYRIVAES